MSDARVGVVRFRVRYSETDQMGLVYHPNYLVWCEIGRTELMRDAGYTYADVERSGIRLAVSEVSVRYARAALYDDVIRVVTRVEAAQSRTITFAYEIVRERDGREELLTTARTRLIAIDQGGSPRRLPPELLQRFRELATTD